jgi:hypothetical protein
MRATPASSWSGLSTQTSGIVQQFGTAMMPSCSSARSGFTSGTTSGTLGSMRHADDLSSTTELPRTACGTSSRLAAAPTAKKNTSTPAFASASGVASSTMPPSSSLPAERAEAKKRTSSKPRSRRIPRRTPPTAPVAPTTPTLGMSTLRFRLLQLEGVV